MRAASEAFPPEIRRLEVFSGPFAAHRLAAQDCDVFFAEYPAGTVIEAHCHDTNNVGVITRGQLHLVLDGVETTYGPGDWYHVPANAEHAARFLTDSAEVEFWFRT